jgi:hypothetical protein
MRLVSGADTVMDFLNVMVNENHKISTFGPIMCKLTHTF